MTTLIQTQLDLEVKAAQQGYDAYMAMVAKNVAKQQESSTVYGMKAMQEMVEKMEAAFNYFLTHQSTLRRKNQAYVNLFKSAVGSTYTNKAGEVLPKYDVASVVAFLLAQTVCDKASGRVYLTSAATTLYKKLTRSFHVEIEDEEVRTSTIAGLVSVVRYLVEAVDFLGMHVEPRRRERGVFVGGKAYVTINEDKVAEMNAMAERMAKFQVFYKPMVSKPVPHTSLVSAKGGYMTLRSPLLKNPTKVDGRIHQSITSFKDKAFFDLINAHQEVGYKVNQTMLELIPQLVAMKAMGDSLHYSVEALEADMMKAAAQEIADLNQSRTEQYGEEAYLLTEKAEDAIKSKWMNTAKQYVALFTNTLEVATEYSEFDAFFYPIFLDDRGRIYYYGKSLNPQGNELHRSLLQFAEGTVMDDTKVMDSFIALGNAMGHDKRSVEFRQQVTMDALPTLLNGSLSDVVALLDADALLTGLAVAMDIKAYYEAKEQGVEYVSYQPLHMDSCNSGSQINGLLLKDERNCRLSNILNVEGDVLEDTYKEVAMMLKAKLEADTSGFFKKFTDAPDIFHRSVFKKSSMTRSNYAASYLTCRQDMEYQLKKNYTEFWNTLTKAEKDAFFLEAVRAVDASLPASNNFKTFARKLVGAAVKRDGCLAYHNPRSGFPVVLRENVVLLKDVRYTEMFTGKAKNFTFKTYTKDLDKSGTISSAIPGMTHSWDAGIIVGVKAKCGNIPMTTIHDSIAVLAGDVSAKLLPSIREVYHEMFTNDDLRVVRDELNIDLDIPYTNDLDGELVLVSQHLYS